MTKHQEELAWRKNIDDKMFDFEQAWERERHKAPAGKKLLLFDKPKPGIQVNLLTGYAQLTSLPKEEQRLEFERKEQLLNREFESLHRQFTTKQRHQLVMRLTGDEAEPLMEDGPEVDKPKWTSLMSQKAVNRFVHSDKLKQDADASDSNAARSVVRKKGSNVCGTVSSLSHFAYCHAEPPVARAAPRQAQQPHRRALQHAHRKDRRPLADR